MSELDSVVEQLKHESVRGARWYVERILEALAKDCYSGRPPSTSYAAKRVVEANPAMLVLHTLAHIFQRCESLCEAVERLRSYVALAKTKLLERACSAIPRSIVTISFSSSVIDAASRCSVEKVYVLESTPGSEGVYAYRELRSRGIEATLLPDTLAPRAVELADAVVLGADGITLDGYVVNKVGSRMLAILAKHFGKPTIVLCEALKVAPKRREEVPIVERSYRALDAEIVAPVFEVVEPSLVTSIVTDVGVYAPESIGDAYAEVLRLVGVGGE